MSCMLKVRNYVVAPQRWSSPLATLDVMMPQAGCCIEVGLECGCAKCGATRTPRHECALDVMLCMPSKQHEVGLQTNCIVVVLALVVRLLDSCKHPYGPRLWVATL